MPAENTDKEKRLKKEFGEDYYAGYFWGNQPFRSSELPGPKKDKDLWSEVMSKLKELDLSNVQAQVVNSVVLLTGTVAKQAEKRKAGVEVWKIHGVVKVSNNIEVKKPILQV